MSGDLVLAVLDETYPEIRGGLAYVVGAAVILVDERDARAAVAGIFTGVGRRRPFHWHKEGPSARNAMVEVLWQIGAIAHICVHYPTGSRSQEAARASALRTVVPKLVHDGASRLLIESRGEVEDRRDRGVILDILNEMDRAGCLAYEWRNKSEALLWLADGICGAVREHLVGGDDSAFQALRDAAVIDRLDYVSSRRNA